MGDDTILMGMKEIAAFLRISAPTVLKWHREYEDFPIRKAAGVWISDREMLKAWFEKYLGGGK